MNLMIHFLKKILDEIFRLNAFKGIVLSLTSVLPSTCQVIWENSELFFLLPRLYGVCIWGAGGHGEWHTLLLWHWLVAGPLPQALCSLWGWGLLLRPCCLGLTWPISVLNKEERSFTKANIYSIGTHYYTVCSTKCLHFLSYNVLIRVSKSALKWGKIMYQMFELLWVCFCF